ncbi:hypothetical protein [Streptomyces sp. WM6378]|uniref:hypothetical protein n=1 Tax=Streptomyces sp. WM6378 TaxID=1415557 RepID=UPI0006AF6F32|nr:hypothetical protein [Streptomyces sp. WM6378]KOU39219.1 hypothetical protein ADK54_26495 [Streptomyces sp. WM6378]
MGTSSRAGLAGVMACMATAAAVTPAAAIASAPTVPIGPPLYVLNNVLPFEAPTLSTGMPLPIPGAPNGPRYVKGKLLPTNMVPAVPVDSALPSTHVSTPLPNPLTSGNIGTPELVSPGSELRAATPGANLGAPINRPEPGHLPVLIMPSAGVSAPDIQGDPDATALF